MRAPSRGSFEKVLLENNHMKNRCDVGTSCEGWNYSVFDGFFGRCGIMDPFESWNRNVKEKDYNESLDLFIELFGCEAFDNPFGGGPEA